MREFKFRVWNRYQFATSTDVYIKSCDGSLWVWDHDDGGLWSADAKIQQYTGLKDKNGVEIYEGDIIINHISYDESLGGQLENSIGVVKWIDRGDKWDYSGWYAYPADLPWGDDDNNVEIIGNIFETPELIKN
jgi:uncharacterized phage protein (TIGR01671 family)